ncbi:MAG: hypothetical protein HQL65_04020 [Magnetococcales bacterium]|nr:hypothetical protein [Magnetococcales bacterium]
MDLLESEVKERPDLRPLAVYGQTVINLFTQETEPGSQVCLLPIYNRDQVLFQESYQEFFSRAQDKWSDTLRAISLLQKNLVEERRQAEAVDPSQVSEVKTPILDRFIAFQGAIRQWDEEALEDNPFLKLTRMIFQLNMEAARGALKVAVAEALAERERMNLQAVPPIREIWWGSSGKRSFIRNMADSLRWLIIGLKPFISVLLFILSTVTTFRGINELLQLPISHKIFGTLFAGGAGETARYVVGLAVGISLSLAILDFKGRLFQGFAEKGRFWKGLVHAFGINPRWIVLATLLTFFSVYTNYDGIVSLVSKQGELQKQWLDIKGRVELVLGDPDTANPDHPQTLHGLKKALELTVKQSVVTFEKLPEDELSGIASSQDPRKGPRYWAKHFVVFGGFTEGLVDLPKVHTNSETSRAINAILLGSGLNFSKSIDEKIRELTTRYFQNFEATHRSIREDLDKLDHIMRPSGRSVAELRRFMTLEHYDINTLVQKITASFEDNKRVYDEVATELNKLLKLHVSVLRQVDKYGSTQQVEYHISAAVDAPDIEGIDALKKGVIPAAIHKDLAALNRFLIDEYGATMARFLLMAILLFSISLDLGELLLFTRFTVKIAKKDEKILDHKSTAITMWNDEFVSKVRTFFEKKEVWFSLLSWLPRPSEILMRDALVMWLFDMDGELKYTGGHVTPWLRWRIWLVRLFRATVRKEICYGLQAWDRALDRVQKALNRNECRFLGVLYPGLQWDGKLEKMLFVQLGAKISAGMQQGQEKFELSLKQTSGVPLCKSIVRGGTLREETKSKMQRDFELTLDKAYKELDPQARRQRQEAGTGNRSPATGKITKNSATCTRCAPKGMLQIWRCVMVSMREGCSAHDEDPVYWVTLYKKIAFFLIYYVYCPIWQAKYWIFTVSFINEKIDYPWSRKRWLYNFCVSNRGRLERVKITSVEKNKIIDIEDILKRIPKLKINKIKEIFDKLDGFSTDWAKTWKLSILHYDNILQGIEEEARMIRGLGKNASDVADEMLLYNKGIGLGNLLYYESPHNFSLLEQFKTIELQIEDAIERISEVDSLYQQKVQFIKEIEDTCSDISRLLTNIKMGLVSGEMDYQGWKLLGGDKVYQQVTEEIQKILEASQEHHQQDVVEQGEEVISKLTQLRNRSKQLHEQLLSAKEVMSQPLARHHDLSSKGNAAYFEPVTESTADPTRQESQQATTTPTWQEEHQAPLPTRQEQTSAIPIWQEQQTSIPTRQDQLFALATRQEQPAVFPARQEQPAVFSARQEQPAVFPARQEQTAVIPSRQEQPAFSPARQEQFVELDHLAGPAIQQETPIYAKEDIRDLFPAQEEIQKSSKGDWAIAIRGQKSPVTNPGRLASRLSTRPGPPQSPFRSQTEEVGSRREVERSVLKTKVEIVMPDGVAHRGVTEDVSVVGVRMKLERAGDGLREGMQGTFRFVRLTRDAGFSCRVVRVSGSDVMLTIHSDTARFGLVVMQEILSQNKIQII